MKIDAMTPVSLPPIQSSDTGASNKSAIAVSLDAAAQTAQVQNEQAQADLSQQQAQQQQQLAQQMDRLNQLFDNGNKAVNFSVDPNTKKVVVRVVDEKKGEVVFQYPSDDALRTFASLEQLSGLLVDRKA
ncbi:MAG TPA: flagellar protein FlaG [Blastocatellia bacterium]|nr:flagellar protein FlaG [Blastocatellia bacterium]